MEDSVRVEREMQLLRGLHLLLLFGWVMMTWVAKNRLKEAEPPYYARLLEINYNKVEDNRIVM